MNDHSCYRELRSLTKHFRPPCLLPRRKRTLWTQPYMVAPALVKTKFGNGKKLVGLLPILHRPSYYLVWVDDSWDLENSGDEWLDKLDEIWMTIGEEFGERPRDSTRAYRWPEEDSDGGCCWFTANAEDILPKRMRRRYGVTASIRVSDRSES